MPMFDKVKEMRRQAMIMELSGIAEYWEGAIKIIDHYYILFNGDYDHWSFIRTDGRGNKQITHYTLL